MDTAAVDVFCGVGGLTRGLEEVGVPTVAGIDVDPHCRHPYQENTEADFVRADIRDISSSQAADLYRDVNCKILVGCAPCQPFSNLNNGEDTDDWEEWALLDELRRLLRDLEPHLVAIENVPEVRNHRIYSRFVDALFKLGYHISTEQVHCHEYGVPQRRQRLILLASKYGSIELDDSAHEGDDPSTVRETIGDGSVEPLPADGESESDRLHKGRALSETNLKRIRQSKPGGTWRDWSQELRLDCHERASGKSYDSVYGRMEWDEPAPTITTQFYNYGSGRFGHPEQDRALTLREGAMLQTFPEDYEFVSPHEEVQFKHVGRLIGNAVPIALAESIGQTIIQHLKRHNVTITAKQTR